MNSGYNELRGGYGTAFGQSDGDFVEESPNRSQLLVDLFHKPLPKLQ
jgi:hypothetical protein